ncbi:Hsp70 family protein [bacterium]|nr:Hsp70 family protein [bacterium]
MLVGIDLGTTNTSVSYVDKKGKLKVLQLGEQKKTLPSVVSIVEGETYVGESAQRQALVNPGRTIFDVKRMLGRKFTDIEVQNSLLKYPYRLIKGNRNQVRILIDNQTYSVEQVVSFILKKIKHRFKEQLGQEITNSVLTVPAYFNNIQRKAMLDAAELANLKVERLISEPTSAAMAYGYYQEDKKKNIAVYDLGGGTFDISLLELENNIFKVLSSYGDTFLGGSDIDYHLFEHLCQDIWEQHKVYIKDSPVLTYKVRSASENIKKELSVHRKVLVELPFLKGPNGKVVSYSKEINRKTLESMSRAIIEKTLIIVQQSLDRAGLKKTDLDDVVLVGGQCKMPMVMDKVANFFGRTAAKIINQDEIVSAGAALFGDALTQKRKHSIVLKDVLPQSMSIRKNMSMKRLFKAGQALPLSKTVKIELDDHEKEHTFFIDEGELAAEKPPENLASVKLNTGGFQSKQSVDMTFSINESGILKTELASSKDNQKKPQQPYIQSHGLNPDEIKQVKNSIDTKLASTQHSKDLAEKQLKELLQKVQGMYLDQKSLFNIDQQHKIERIFKLGPAVLNHGDHVKMQKMLESLYVLQQQLV